MKYTKGSILLEVFIAVMAIGIAFGALLDVARISTSTSSLIKEKGQANALLKEALETARSFRDGKDWAVDGLGNTGVIIPGDPYHFELDTSADPDTWNPVAGSQPLGNFTREIVFDQVSRNPATLDIESVYNPANDDPDTKKVTATVSWTGQSMTLATYLTNWEPI